MNEILTEKDLERIFSGKNPTNHSLVKLKNVSKSIAILALSVVFFYVILNFNGIKEKFVYWYRYDYKNEQTEESPTVVAQIVEEEIEEKPVMDDIVDNHLKINSINAYAPITWNVENTPTETKTNLENGLIHLKGTAMPGEIGNVFVTGHSSNYPWAKGKYNNVFALLDKLVIGETIQLKYQEKDFLYEIKDIKVVNPDDVSVLQPTKNSVLTLMTCTPLGTSLRRLIITSVQYYPNPTKNTPSNTRSIEAKEIPKAR